MCKSNLISLDDLPPTVREGGEENWIRIPVGTNLSEAERIIIQETLSANKMNKSRTAEVLEIGRKTLHRKLADFEERQGEVN